MIPDLQIWKSRKSRKASRCVGCCDGALPIGREGLLYLVREKGFGIGGIGFRASFHVLFRLLLLASVDSEGGRGRGPRIRAIRGTALAGGGMRVCA